MAYINLDYITFRKQALADKHPEKYCRQMFLIADVSISEPRYGIRRITIQPKNCQHIIQGYCSHEKIDKIPSFDNVKTKTYADHYLDVDCMLLNRSIREYQMEIVHVSEIEELQNINIRVIFRVCTES